MTKKITGVVLAAVLMVGTTGNAFANVWESNGCTSAIDYIEKLESRGLNHGMHRLSTGKVKYEYEAMHEEARRFFSDEFLNTGKSLANHAGFGFIEFNYALCNNKWKACKVKKLEDGNYYFCLPEDQTDLNNVIESIRQQQFMEQWVRNRVAGMPANMESVKELYSEIALNTEYDLTLKHWTAYDAVVNHSSVCQGLSRLFDAELQALGIESYYIEGKFNIKQNVNYGNDHAWNAFVLDGKIYVCDITQAIKYKNERDIFDFFGEDPTMSLVFVKDEIDADYIVSCLY